MPQRDIVVIGGSAGAIVALQQLVQKLPEDFAAAILIVVHLSPQSAGLLPDILTRAGPLPACNARQHKKIQRGHIYVAPPDRHLLVTEDEKVRIGYGPRENRFRPAVDPLFRSAALAYGPRVIGVVLSGGLDDGTAGLCAVKRMGGLAIVQDPNEAESRSMPETALMHVAADYIVPIDQMAALLSKLVREPVDERSQRIRAMPDDMRIEVETAANGKPHPGILKLGPPSIFTCPECHGSLLRVAYEAPARFRCHTGHAYTAAALEDELREKIEMAGWSTVRALQEHAMLLEELMQQPETSKEDVADFKASVEDALRRAGLVRQALARGGSQDA